MFAKKQTQPHGNSMTVNSIPHFGNFCHKSLDTDTELWNIIHRTLEHK